MSSPGRRGQLAGTRVGQEKAIEKHSHMNHLAHNIDMTNNKSDGGVE